MRPVVSLAATDAAMSDTGIGVPKNESPAQDVGILNDERPSRG
jgi:hypothetical protein